MHYGTKTHLQAQKSKKGKEKMVGPEPQQAYEVPAETESSASVVRSRMANETPVGLGLDGAGPSRPRMEEGMLSRPNV